MPDAQPGALCTAPGHPTLGRRDRPCGDVSSAEQRPPQCFLPLLARLRVSAPVAETPRLRRERSLFSRGGWKSSLAAELNVGRTLGGAPCFLRTLLRFVAGPPLSPRGHQPGVPARHSSPRSPLRPLALLPCPRRWQPFVTWHGSMQELLVAWTLRGPGERLPSQLGVFPSGSLPRSWAQAPGCFAHLPGN